MCPLKHNQCHIHYLYILSSFFIQNPQEHTDVNAVVTRNTAVSGGRGVPCVPPAESPHVVRHLLGYDHGELDEALHRAVLEPRRLVNHLLDPFLVDGVNVRRGVVEQVVYYLLRALLMAWHHALPDLVAECGERFLVLIDDDTLCVAYRDADVD